MYKQGKRRFKSEGKWFKIRRGGPDNNWLTASPEDPRYVAPVVNTAYDESKARKAEEAKAGRNLPAFATARRAYNKRKPKS